MTEVLRKLAKGLSSSEKLETDDTDADLGQDSALAAKVDVLTEILDKMTGVTAAVANPQDQPGKIPEDIAKILVTEGRKQTDALMLLQDIQEVGVGQEKLEASEIIPEEAAGNTILTLSEDDGTIPVAEAQLVPKPSNPSAEKPVDTARKGQVSLPTAVSSSSSSKPVSSSPQGQKNEVKKDLAENAPIDPVRNAVIADVLTKRSIAPVNDIRTGAPHVPATEVATPDISHTQTELRPVRVNPPTIFRQITDTVVIMRDEMVEIRLSPEELGRIRMVLTGQDRAPHLTIWVDRPEVLEQMRRQGDSLLQQLREQGMSGASLDFRDGRQTQDDTRQDQSFSEQRGKDLKDRPLMVLPETSRRSIVTPFLSGRHGINIKV